MDRLWSKVERGPACWVWQAHRNRAGYGQFWFEGRSQKAHRIVWIITYGEIPDGLCVLHRCDNPPCCNPEHLFLGTKADNTADMDAKGRRRSAYGDAHGSRTHPEQLARGDDHHARRNPDRLARGDSHGSRTHPERLLRGEANKASKLIEDDVREIRRLYATGAWTQAALGRKFGVSGQLISYIVHRKIWKHVL